MSIVMEAEGLFASAEDISDEIEALDGARTALFAVYGAGGTYDDERKALLCVVAERIRDNARTSGQQIGGRGGLTDGQVDDMAHADPQYQARITQATEERTMMALLDTLINGKLRRFALAQQRMNTMRKLAGLQ